ncbi:thioester reductase domain-containing protein [Paenibacillus polymyxa]|uniref:thioester reductase domain-containing protein n=1 Tax=Paenibacillus polymyxa TaxID=1406 RepID=UPI003216300D
MDLDVFMNWEEVKSKLEVSTGLVYVLSTFTANPIEPYLGMHLFQRGLNRRISFGPYNQVIQQLSNVNSQAYRDEVESIIIWIRMEDMVEKQMMEGPVGFEHCLEDADVLAEVIVTASEHSGKPFIVVLPAMCDIKPAGIGDLQFPNGMMALSLAFRSRLLEALRGKHSIMLCDAEEALRKVSVEKAFDPALYALAKVPYTTLMFAEVSRLIAECIRLSARSEPPILIFDVAMLISEDYDPSISADKIDVLLGHVIARDDSIHNFQQYIRMIAAWGCELMFCTASDDETLRDIFSDEDIMLPYETAKYVCCEIDSVKKCVEKISMSKGLSPERFIFITQRVPGESGLEGIPLLSLPEDRSLWIRTINDSGCTNHKLEPVPQQSIKTGGVKSSENHFFNRLELSVVLKDVGREKLEQVEHLLLDVHDFRFTNMVWKAEELSAKLDKPNVKLLGVYVKDRFGEYGMAGLVISHTEGNCFYIDDLMLNCRVLGKRVEYHVMDRLAEISEHCGCGQIGMSYTENGHNQQAKSFIAEMTGTNINEVTKRQEIFVTYQELAVRAAGQIHTTSNEVIFNKAVGDELSASDLLKKCWDRKTREMQSRIIDSAIGLVTAKDIMKEINSVYRTPQMINCEYVSPRSETESELARLWGNILHLDRVGVMDNFFAIGGTSILATQLIVKFKETFGINLPVRIFFDKSNIEQMALYIDALKLEHDEQQLTEDAIQNYRVNLREFLRKEAWLEESISAVGKPGYKSPLESSSVFLTGATGFLGAFLLSELLNKTNYTVVCLVRASDEWAGMQKIINNLNAYMIWDDAYLNRVSIICGDMAKPLLDLSADAFEGLADQVDMIYHCGANTNFLEPYQMLKPANVNGTQEILRLATTKRLKIVHFVSTHYVFSTISNPADHVIYEDEIPSSNEILIMGYQQTKLISEQIVAIARDRGIPVNIYRPGRISGSSVTGACQTRDFVWLMVKSCVESGMVFSEDSKIELIPVDYVSEAIVNISLASAALNRNFHIINHTRPPMEFISRWMEERGFKVEKYPYMEWKDRLTERVATDDGLHTVRAMLPFINEEAELDKSLQLDTRNADEVLKNSDIIVKEVDRNLFNKYLDYFIRIGFFSVPKTAAR